MSSGTRGRTLLKTLSEQGDKVIAGLRMREHLEYVSLVPPVKRLHADGSLVSEVGEVLRCTVCMKEFPLDRGAEKLMQHMKGAKHLQHVQKRIEDTRKQLQIKFRPANNRLLPDKAVRARQHVLSALLEAAVPIEAIQNWSLNQILTAGTGSSLGGVRGLRDYIPHAFANLQAQVRALLADVDAMSIAFDSTPFVGDTFAVVARHFDHALHKFKRTLVSIVFLEKEMNGDELEVMLSTILSNFNIDTKHVVAFCRDGCNVNSSAMRKLFAKQKAAHSALSAVVGGAQHAYRAPLDLACLCHAIDNTGARIDIPALERILSPWLTVISHSKQARKAFLTFTHEAPKSYSKTRWWSRYEVVAQLVRHMHTFRSEVIPMLRANKIAKESVGKIAAVLEDSKMSALLLLEGAIVLDVVQKLVAATYLLESDGPVMLQCAQLLTGVTNMFDSLEALHTPVADKSKLDQYSGDSAQKIIPSVIEAAAAIVCSKERETTQQANDMMVSCVKYALGTVSRAREYWSTCLLDSPTYADVLAAANMASILNPVVARRALNDVATGSTAMSTLVFTTQVNAFARCGVRPSVTDECLRKEKLYRAKCFQWFESTPFDVPRTGNATHHSLEAIERFWTGESSSDFTHEDDGLHCYFTLYCIAGLLQPHVAVVDRCFSVLDAAVSKRQRTMLHDYASSLMYSFTRRLI